MTALGVRLVLFGGSLVLSLSCDERPRGGAAVTAPPPSNAMAAASTPIIGSSVPAVSAAATSAATNVLERYPAVLKPLTEPCADARVVLAVRKQFDRSGRVWVQQALLAHPELQVATEKAQRPGQVDVYETIYGTKNFARSYPGQPLFSEAVVARCADVTTCNRLAAMFHAVAPTEKVELTCGVPPATTGGFGRVSELSPERLRAPAATGSSPIAVCARLHACAVREGTPLQKEFACSRSATAELQVCAAADSCDKVAACSATLVK